MRIETSSRVNPVWAALQRKDIWGFVACVVFFILWPQTDLYVSRYFYEAQQGFSWNEIAIIGFIYRLTGVVSTIILISLLVGIALSYLIKKDITRRYRKTLTYLLACFLIGPGVIVNLVLKDHWDRPRPSQVVEFGGDHQYQAPFSPTFTCDTCHSFVSGHASVGFYLFSIALLFRRKRWLALPLVAGAIIGFGRITQGGHFLSDVIFSGWTVWLTTLLMLSVFQLSGPLQTAKCEN
jgi:lipid A 4'-phosphatase